MGPQAGGPVDRAIAEVAARQYGVVSLAQLRALGLSGSAVRGRVATGRLRRLHQTAFAVGHAALRPEGFWIAAVLACGSGALLSHRSAAEHQGLVARRGRSVIDVTVPRTARNRPGVRVHESSTLTERDITVIAGIPCTSAARTLLDLAESSDVRTIERALSEAERRRVFDLRAIEDVLGRAVGRRGAPRLVAALERLDPLSHLTRSELERRLLAICRTADIPRPRVNAWIELPGGGIEVDLCWPARRLIVEADGRDTHATAIAFEGDRRRDQRLVAAGWRVVRFTWRQVVREPQLVVATLAELSGPTGP